MCVHRILAPVVLVVPMLLGACSGDGDDFDDEYVERPVDELYTTALDLLEEGDYLESARAFEEVERQHPYSQWATRAQLMSAFAFYEASAYDDAVAAADRFIELHPGNSSVPYAHYLIGVSHYEQISDVGRDQEMTGLALAAFDELVARFPETAYARDAALKADLARDHLAGKEMEIGRYYLNQGKYVAAINRFKSVVDRYQTTSHVPEALHRLTEAYLALGIEEEAQRAAAVLGHNFPDSEWYQDSYVLMTGSAEPENDSWFGGTLDAIF